MISPVDYGAVVAAREAELEMERQLLGELMLDSPRARPAVDATGLTAANFANDANAAIFGAWRAAVGRGEDGDFMTVCDVLAETGSLQRAGGMGYVNEVAALAVTASNVGQHAAAVLRADRRRRLRTLGAALERTGDLAGIGEALLAELQALDGQPDKPGPFRAVDVAALADHVPPAPDYWWHGYLPAGLVTVLGAHGGTGKSMLALMLCVCIALGRPLFGVATRRGIAVYYSGEDGADLLAYRLHWICECLGVSPVDLEGRLHLLDATEGDPVLFRETQEGGRRLATTTAAYAALKRMVEAVQADVLVVDGMSDTFDGNEIQRASVGAYLRALGMLAKPQRAVLLLAHVDKATARGDTTGGQGYSGSTAVHNRVRSRLFGYRDRDGTLVLEHQKHNLGRLREPLRLVWPEGKLPDLQAPESPALQHLVAATDTKAVLRLIHEFHCRGEFVATAPTSSANAARMLSGQPGYPTGRRAAEVFDLLRDAERARYIERQAYTNPDRKARERWALTYSGCALIGVTAPGAPPVPTVQGGAPGAGGGAGALPAPPSGARGVGRGGAHEGGASAPPWGSA